MAKGTKDLSVIGVILIPAEFSSDNSMCIFQITNAGGFDRTITLQKQVNPSGTFVNTSCKKDSDRTLVAAGAALTPGIYYIDATGCQLQFTTAGGTIGTATLTFSTTKGNIV